MRRNLHFVFSFFMLMGLTASWNAVNAQAIGADDFRISTQGPDGDDSFNASDPDVAYNATDKEYLVVWSGDTTAGEDEIYVQRINALDGSLIGTAIKISNQGTPGDTDYDANDPSVAWNATDNQYMVVWGGDSDQGNLVNGEGEIWGTVLTNMGMPVPSAPVRISFQGVDGDNAIDAFTPAIEYNPMANNFMVVWTGDSINGENEIWGQVMNADGSMSGNNLRLTNLGPDGDGSYDCGTPNLAYNSQDNNYMLTYYGDLQPGEHEIYGAILNASGVPQGMSVQISDMGPANNTSYDAFDPDIAYNPLTNEFLIVWESDDSSATVVEGETEIWGQRVSATGVQQGTDDFRISMAGPDGRNNYDAFEARVIYNQGCREFMVVWTADDSTSVTTDGEVEVFLQRIDGMGNLVGGDSLVSAMGPDNDDRFEAEVAAIAATDTLGEFLIVWAANDSVLGGNLSSDEQEIYGQRWGCEIFVNAETATPIEGVQAYPNPVDGQLNLLMGNVQGKAATVKVSDVLGKVVFEAAYGAAPAKVELNLNNVPAGILLMTVEAEGTHFTQKLIKR